MASKFNVQIEGGSGSIVMGDNTRVDITHVSGSGLRNQGPVKRAPLHTRLGAIHLQETGVKGDDPISYKITQGYALIIHNKYFPNKSEPERRGSDKDVEAIKDFCGNAGLTINDSDRKTENLKATEIEDLCKEISRRDFSRYDGFVCFILSHGTDQGIYGVDDNITSVQAIVSKFNDCASLAGKPKLFFIQACRGTGQDGGVEADSYRIYEKVPLRLPKESDTLIAYSAVEGYESYRSTEHGSWFVITLMEKLFEYGHNRHLMDILTLVNKQIAEYETPSGKKQMSCQMTTLTKFVFFNVPPPPNK